MKIWFYCVGVQHGTSPYPSRHRQTTSTDEHNSSSYIRMGIPTPGQRGVGHCLPGSFQGAGKKVDLRVIVPKADPSVLLTDSSSPVSITSPIGKWSKWTGNIPMTALPWWSARPLNWTPTPPWKGDPAWCSSPRKAASPSPKRMKPTFSCSGTRKTFTPGIWH